MTGESLHLTGRIMIDAHTVVSDMWVVGGKVSFTAPVGGAQHTLRGYVLPGLVDAHCHVGLDEHGGVSRERARTQAEIERDAGALLLRDAGSPVDTHWIDQEPDLPKIIRAGRHIARTKRYIRHYAHEIEPSDLVEYVRQEARRGDGWVKLVGDWIDRDTGDLNTCWPAGTLKEAVAAAHEEGARVTAHCFAEQSLVDFAAAGVDCIEHATGLRDDTIATFASQGIAIVPTLVNIENFPHFAEAGEKRFPDYARHMRDLYARRYHTVGQAHDAGVPIYVGTDAGGQVPHGLAGREVVELTKAGLSPVEAISAATWGARAWLGRPAIAEGEDVDVVVYHDDPLTDLSVLSRPAHIILRGKKVA